MRFDSNWTCFFLIKSLESCKKFEYAVGSFLQFMQVLGEGKESKIDVFLLQWLNFLIGE